MSDSTTAEAASASRLGSGHDGSPLVSPPPERRLPLQTRAPKHGNSGDTEAQGDWWLLAVQGGAGVSCLRRAGVAARDAERCWPAEGLVVVVARRTAYGLEWARDAARQSASGEVPPGVLLAGLAVVADAPGRTPRRIARFLDLVGAAYPRVWEVPWVEEWRLAGQDEPLPLPPAARQLDRDMQKLTNRSAQPGEERDVVTWG